mmetsp:Transcript_2048/g.8212  ORF Transcript_2048/g.8212 Transcript_2048/m.8212 type:complete len:371 (-) Transcript_2048:650-1762(-)
MPTHERGGAVGERALRRQHPRRAARGVDYANREGRQAGRPHLQLRSGVRRARRAGRHLRRRSEAHRRGGARGIQLHHLCVRTDGHGQDAHDGGLPRLGRRILGLFRRFDAQQRGRHPAGHVAHIRAPEGQRRGAQRQVHVPGALQRRNHRSAGRVGPRRGHRRGCQRQSPEASVDGGRKRRRRGEGTGGGHGGQPRGDLRPHQAGKRETSHRGDADEQAIQQVALRLQRHRAHQGVHPRRRGRHPVRQAQPRRPRGVREHLSVGRRGQAREGSRRDQQVAPDVGPRHRRAGLGRRPRAVPGLEAHPAASRRARWEEQDLHHRHGVPGGALGGGDAPDARVRAPRQEHQEQARDQPEGDQKRAAQGSAEGD